MSTFTVFLVSASTFAFLVYYFSIWTAFGATYMAGMLLVALIAFFGRRRQRVGFTRESV